MSYVYVYVYIHVSTSCCKAIVLHIIEMFLWIKAQGLTNTSHSSWRHHLWTVCPLWWLQQGQRPTSTMATVIGTAWHQRQHECFHLTRPVTTVIVAMYIAWQQWCRQAQRFQWGFAKGSIVGNGQQQNLEQRSSYKYFSSYMSLGPPRHFSAAMSAFSCPSCLHDVLHQCLPQPINSVAVFCKSCACCDCLCLTWHNVLH